MALHWFTNDTFVPESNDYSVFILILQTAWGLCAYLYTMRAATIYSQCGSWLQSDDGLDILGDLFGRQKD